MNATVCQGCGGPLENGNLIWCNKCFEWEIEEEYLEAEESQLKDHPQSEWKQEVENDDKATPPKREAIKILKRRNS